MKTKDWKKSIEISTNENVKMKGNLMVATTQRAESIANVIPNLQSNKPTASDIHHQSIKETEKQRNRMKKYPQHLIFIIKVSKY